MRQSNFRWKLKTITPLLAWSLTLLGIFTVGILVYLSDLTRHAAKNTHRTFLFIETASAIDAQVLRLEPLTFAYLSSKDPTFRRDIDKIEKALPQLFNKLRGALVTDEERNLFRMTEERVNRYIVFRRKVESQGIKANTRTLLAPLLEEAMVSLDQLGSTLLVQADGAATRAEKWNRFVEWVGIVIGIIFLLALWLVLHHTSKTFAQLTRLRDAISTFASGDSFVRAPSLDSAELDEIATVFNELVDRLHQLEKVRVNFLAGVAHDIRNPLTAMKSATQVLQLNKSKLSEKNIEVTLDVLSRQVTRIERMIGDFLDSARIQAGALELKPEFFDLAQVVREAVALWRPTSLAHNFVTQLPDGPVWIKADPGRIYQVLNNLFGNAIKYSPNGGEIEVKVCNEGDGIALSVKDSGIGIARNEISHIYEPFRRTARTRELIPGAGLGLSVTKKIVEAHGGTIKVTSVEGRGTIFVIRLPIECVESKVA